MKTIKEILDLIEWGMATLFVIVIGTALVIWIHGNEALRLSVPWLIYTLVIVGCVAAVFWLTTYAIARYYLTRRIVAEQNRDTILARNEGRLSDISLQRSQLHLEVENAMAIAQIGQMSQGMVFASNFGENTFSSHTKSIATMADGVPLLTDPAMPNLLDAIVGLENVLIVGGKGSGKTTLLQWLEAERVRRGKVIVLDSHTQPSKWQGQVVGIGRNYKLIKNAMISIVEMLDRRYKVFSTGQSHFEPVATFIDEFTMLPKTLKDSLGYDIKAYSVPVLTEGRKVGIAAVWGIHSDRAEMMGLKGMSDLKECFDCIVRLVKVEGRPAYALVDFGEGVNKEVHYQLPGKFIIAGQAEPVDDSEPPRLTDDLPVWNYSQGEDEDAPAAEPDDRAEQIRQMAAEGMSKTAIAQHFGYKSNAGAIYYEIRAALGEDE